MKTLQLIPPPQYLPPSLLYPCDTFPPARTLLPFPLCPPCHPLITWYPNQSAVQLPRRQGEQKEEEGDGGSGRDPIHLLLPNRTVSQPPWNPLPAANAPRPPRDNRIGSVVLCATETHVQQGSYAANPSLLSHTHHSITPLVSPPSDELSCHGRVRGGPMGQHR